MSRLRQAMAYAINRQRASTLGEFGYEPASNQSGIVTPTFSTWLNTSQAAVVRQQLRLRPGEGRVDPHQGPVSRRDRTGSSPRTARKLSFSIINNGGVLRLGERGQT